MQEVRQAPLNQCDRKEWPGGVGDPGHDWESGGSLFPLAEPPLAPDRFVTPDQKYSMDNTPHTPTPFKNALEKYGPLKPLVCAMVAVTLCGVDSSDMG